MEEELANSQMLVIICIFHPPCFPPKGPTQSAGQPPGIIMSAFIAIKQIVIFGHRFWVDLGSFCGAILVPCSALLAPKLAQVRSKTRLEGLSIAKT